MVRTSNKKIIQNPELERAFRGWAPEMGNAEDKSILKRLDTINKELRSVNNEALRDPTGKGRTPKMNGILSKEKALIEIINKRKMDF